ncbi:tubulin-tyrosine ligase family protein, putative [Ichthyophthirius multifiliis]|uniref:Tubulin-tyrosine ligase family protein, putative n=1 Tax=Ichthyophthirius multifiliis TaxID=5932 RepID=G0QJ68_ICHMU|nr:tubulin-tyrosine ligase family protein, putative [Ichthyophthirius multifiliis]EGR34749.1 tubulin-tyrosine ligase family protein, putative [Ichthyophthirius multifiliis]|eukprot:XP_004040053.1 tubulin-tyrosine ligase family protein, putative [Ichthyophthirius multifiliis]
MEIQQDKCSKVVLLNDQYNYKIHNHVENNFSICNKKVKKLKNHNQFFLFFFRFKQLFYNLKKYYEFSNENIFNYIPLTFHIKNGIDDLEWIKFIQYYNEIQDDKKQQNIWIIKPGEQTNRGNGIQVLQKLSDIQEIIYQNKYHENGRKKTYLIQKYIEKPFLFNKRKFDIRCYLLITTYNGLIKGYWYQEGYLRTSSKEFNLKNLENKFVHLTNDAIQKKSEEFGKFEIGNKLSFNEFQRYLDFLGQNKQFNFIKKTQQEMKVIFLQKIKIKKKKKIACDIVKSVYKKIQPNKSQFSFELFGLDFMIDSNFKTWLIEANSNPCLQTNCLLLSRIITNLLDNTFKIAVDPLFPPLNIPKSKNYLIPLNAYESNKFELIFDDQNDGKKLAGFECESIFLFSIYHWFFKQS